MVCGIVLDCGFCTMLSCSSGIVHENRRPILTLMRRWLLAVFAFFKAFNRFYVRAVINPCADRENSGLFPHAATWAEARGRRDPAVGRTGR